MNIDSHSDEQIKKILGMKKIAVIGMSRHEKKAAHFVPKYLDDNGYDVTPVNPTTDEILQKKCYKVITDVPHDVDIVDVDILENKVSKSIVWYSTVKYRKRKRKEIVLY